MESDPLLSTILDLDSALPNQQLLIGGGYGLFLKQQYLLANPDIRTVFPLSKLPVARTTEDIDLILRADIVTDSTSMGTIRQALDELGFKVIETAKYTQFVRPMSIGEVKIDLLAAPLGEFAERVPKDSRRVKPRPSVKLHASKMEEALSVDQGALEVAVNGTTNTGIQHSAQVLIPQSFAYLLMKLHAFKDRMADVRKDHGRHHALDVYRIVGMLTEDEDKTVRDLYQQYAQHGIVEQTREIVASDFFPENGIGRIRIQEHALYSDAFDLNGFGRELGELFEIAK